MAASMFAPRNSVSETKSMTLGDKEDKRVIKDELLVPESLRKALLNRIRDSIDQRFGVEDQFPKSKKIYYEFMDRVLQLRMETIKECVGEFKNDFFQKINIKYQSDLQNLVTEFIVSKKKEATSTYGKDKNSTEAHLRCVEKFFMDNPNLGKDFEIRDARHVCVVLDKCQTEMLNNSEAHHKFIDSSSELEMARVNSLVEDKNYEDAMKSLQSLYLLLGGAPLKFSDLTGNPTIKEYLKHRFEINRRDASGYLPIHYACIIHDFELASTLIKSTKPQLLTKDETGTSLLHLILKFHGAHTENFLTLLNPGEKHIFNTFSYAFHHNNLKALSWMTSKIKLESKNLLHRKLIQDGFFLACMMGYKDIVNFVLHTFRDTMFSMGDLQKGLRESIQRNHTELFGVFFDHGVILESKYYLLKECAEYAIFMNTKIMDLASSIPAPKMGL